MRGASHVFAGCSKDLTAGDRATWKLDAGILSNAGQDVRIMLSASPVTAIPVDREILSSRASLLTLQSEYRLRIHKRMLHWVFLDA